MGHEKDAGLSTAVGITSVILGLETLYGLALEESVRMHAYLEKASSLDAKTLEMARDFADQGQLMQKISGVVMLGAGCVSLGFAVYHLAKSYQRRE